MEPIPPARMPLIRGGRPLKTWTYVGAYGPDVMLCATRGRIGLAPFAWWAVWDRRAGELTQGRRGVSVAAGRVVVRGVFDLTIGPGRAVEAVCPSGGQYAWTRKHVADARGTLAGRPLELRAIVDESAGYHARHTAWCWSTGVGFDAAGAPVAWNLVNGINDPPTGSERAVWVGGEPREVPPVTFAGDLSAVAGLRFTAEATLARRQNLGLVRSDYEQPFGTFAGELPGGPALAEGWGVMERHEVYW
jgi:hypothetical protein